MKRYLRVSISGKHGDEVHYAALEDGVDYTLEELQQIGQDVVNEEYSWGFDEELLDESEVPEDHRVG